ncbi:LysR family transcriptional regulator [Pelagibacterium halotolerans]|uniref:LysR family transcriptional regulator n=1 Tax=Pelagibacterium halotolerans TaxID=531813 RepID=UPI0005A014F3|nr:LysR family transcriptional regulator [Pelagibacterium halotolerans]QJR18132.1 LysR family transcriptional regulator [Pelagibacterium halotolerans]
MQFQLDDIPVFAAIVDQNGISAAARQLGMSKSAVSKILTRLEQAIGTRLIDRNSRNLRITADGETFYRQCQPIIEQAENARAVMGGLLAEPVGRLVVAVPPAFAREVLSPHLPGFTSLYPGIELEIIVTTQKLDILRDQIDLAVVVGAIEDTDLVARPLYQGRLMWVTSARYAAGYDLGHTSDDLLSHLRICETRYAHAGIAIREGGVRRRLPLSNGVVKVNDPIIVREAIMNGMGISFLPDQYCRSPLQSGDLVEIYDKVQFDQDASVLSAVYPSRRLLSNRTRAFLDFLLSTCRRL